MFLASAIIFLLGVAVVAAINNVVVVVVYRTDDGVFFATSLRILRIEVEVDDSIRKDSSSLIIGERAHAISAIGRNVEWIIIVKFL